MIELNWGVIINAHLGLLPSSSSPCAFVGNHPRNFGKVLLVQGVRKKPGQKQDNFTLKFILKKYLLAHEVNYYLSTYNGSKAIFQRLKDDLTTIYVREDQMTSVN